MESKIIRVTGYGLFCLSLDSFQSFLKQKKIKTKKINKFFDKEKSLLEEALKTGAFLPIAKISSVRYLVNMTLDGIQLEDGWDEVLNIEGCNLSVGKDGTIWVGSLDMLDDWNSEEFKGDVISYKTLDGQTLNMAFSFPVEQGDYKVNIIGLKKKNIGEYTDANYMFLYKFRAAQSSEFDKYSNSLAHNVNIAKM